MSFARRFFPGARKRRNSVSAPAGNPDSIIVFNPGVIPRILSITPHEDYTAGEINDPNRVEIRRAVDGKIDGTQVHTLSYLGRTWGMGSSRFSAEQVVKLSQGIRKQGGVDQCKLSKSMISKIETNKVVPSVATLAKLAKSLGTSVSALLERNGDLVVHIRVGGLRGNRNLRRALHFVTAMDFRKSPRL